MIFTGAILLSVFAGATPLDSSVLSNPIVAVVAPVIILLTAGPLQEEFGWRGYALPRLQKRFIALVSSLVLGVSWWLWHLPLVFIPDKFMVSTPLLFGVLMVEMVLATILFTWIYNNTGGSILATMLFHIYELVYLGSVAQYESKPCHYWLYHCALGYSSCGGAWSLEAKPIESQQWLSVFRASSAQPAAGDDTAFGGAAQPQLVRRR